MALFKGCVIFKKDNLKRHEMTHTGEKKLIAENKVVAIYCLIKRLCDFQKNNLKRHEMTHTGEK